MNRLRNAWADPVSWHFDRRELLVLAALFSIGELLGIPQDAVPEGCDDWQKRGLRSLEQRGFVKIRFDGEARVQRPLNLAMRALAQCHAQAVNTRRSPGEDETSAFYHFYGELCVRFLPSPFRNELTLYSAEEALLELSQMGEIDADDCGLICEGIAIDSLADCEIIKDALQGSMTFNALRVRQIHENRPADMQSVLLVQSPDSTMKIVPGSATDPQIRDVDIRWIQKEWDDCIDAVMLD